MAVAYDSNSGSTPQTGNTASFSINYAAASGADVFLIVSSNTLGAHSISTTPQYNGVNMTLVYEISHGAFSGGTGGYGNTWVYRRAACGDGSSHATTGTFSTTPNWVISVSSYTGVGSLGTVVPAYGTGTTASTGSVTCPSGGMLLAAMGVGSYYGDVINSTTGGTNRAKGAYTGGWAALAVNDATATTGFTATINSSEGWSTIVVPLIPAGSDVVVTPAGAAVSATGGTPTLIQPVTVTPTGAAVAATGGTPTVARPVTVTPAGATVSATSGTPTVVQPVTVTPAAATVSAIGGTPTLIQPVTVTPAAATVSAAGGTPTVVQPVIVTPTGALVVATGGIPDTAAPVTVTPAAATVSAIGGTPTLIQPVTVTPAGATVSATGGIPALTVTQNVTVTPTGATVSAIGGLAAVYMPVIVIPQPYAATLVGGVCKVRNVIVEPPPSGRVAVIGAESRTDSIPGEQRRTAIDFEQRIIAVDPEQRHN